MSQCYYSFVFLSIVCARTYNVGFNGKLHRDILNCAAEIQK